MSIVLIAAELVDLLPRNPVPGYTVNWLPSATATPAGSHVAIIPLLSRRIGEAELKALPDLRIVANCAVGYDNIDLEAAAQHGVVVTNTPDVLTEATADLAWTLILAVARRLKEGQDLLAEGRWEGWHPTQLLGLELSGAVLGVVGAGRIGQAVARRAVGFGMRIIYADPAPRPELEQETGAEQVALAELLDRSDVVSLHVPSSSQTRRMFGRKEFSRMRAGALFINTARGELVDEEALLDALERGHLGGAGLDVFAQEPRVPDGLVAHPRVVALPHLGSATTRTRQAMAELAVRNVRAVLEGEPPITPVPRPPAP
jgi:glyoxylate reductase